MFFLVFLIVLLKLIFSPLGADGAEAQHPLFYLPDVFVLIASSFVLAKSKPSATRTKIIGFILLAFFFVFISSLANDKSFLASCQAAVKTLLPLFFLVAMLSAANNANAHAIYKCAHGLSLCILILSTLGFIFFAADANRGDSWLPAYFSGLHTSTYVLFGGVISAYACFKYKKSRANRLYLHFYFVFSLAMFTFGWGVRTILFSSILFFVSIYFSRIKIDPALTLICTFSFGIFLLITLMGFEIISFKEFDLYTSGRISMYGEKVDFISKFDFFDWMWGRGAGSDLMISDVWWWAKKGSHNDFLTLFVENGTIFMISLLSVFYLIYTRYCVSAEQKSILVVILFSSLVSNGYLTRPMPFYCLIFPFIIFSYRLTPTRKPLTLTSLERFR